MTQTMQHPGDVSAALGIPFSDEQLEAITAPLEPGVIVAGAGTGKTTVMAARVVWLVGSGQVRPDQILGLTFTRKAAGELAARIDAALSAAGLQPGDDEAAPVVSTYDAFAGTVLAEHGARIGLPGGRRVLGAAAAFRLATRAARADMRDLTRLPRLKPDSVTERILQLDAALSAHLVDLDDLRVFGDVFRAAVASSPPNSRGDIAADLRHAADTSIERDELARFVRLYRGFKRDAGVTEFADQMSDVAQVVTSSPLVGSALREQFSVVLLDEYQDTSAAQVMVLRALFSGPDAGAGRGFPVTAVGDPLQAIYGWRGAAAANIASFAREFPRSEGGPARRYGLSVNRRSGPGILAVANALSAPLREGGGGNELVAAPGAPVTRVVVGQFLTRDEELEWVCDQVSALRTADPGAGGVAAWSDIAVLTRTNEGIGDVYSRLVERDVPAEIVGLGGLLDVPEVADVVATLRVVDDITANPALVRLLAGPRWRIADADLVALGRRAKELAGSDVSALAAEDPADLELRAAVRAVDAADVPSMVDALDDPGPGLSQEARRRLARLSGELRMLRTHSGEPLGEFVRRVIAACGLDVELTASPDLLAAGGRRQLSAFLAAVDDFVDTDPEASLSGLLGYLDAARDREGGLEQAAPSALDAVKLLTVHRAKGLEWDAVFCPLLVDGSFPNHTVGDNWLRAATAVPAPLRGDAADIPQLATVDREGVTAYGEALKREQRRSEDRLAYVAASRARRVLMMTCASWQRGTKKPKSPSPYLLQAWPLADEVAAEVADAGEANPCDAAAAAVAWPAPDPERLRLKAAVAQSVREARERARREGGYPQIEATSLDVAAQLADWDQEADALIEEARRAHPDVIEVPLPASLTTYQVMQANQDPQRFAATVARPMPAPPSRAAERGTRFHAWVERRFAVGMLPGLEVVGDEETDARLRIDDDADLADLCRRFAAGQFGERAPAAMEVPFAISLGRMVRGRIDAVYREPDGTWLVVDWKTARAGRADRVQLAVYRQAWAELRRIPTAQVRAAFYYVRRDELDVIEALPTRNELIGLVEDLIGSGSGDGDEATTPRGRA